MTPRMSALDPAGPQASEIAWTWDVYLIVAVIVWLLVVAFIVISIVISRRNPPLDPMSEDSARERRLTRSMVAAGAATVLTLLGLLVVSIASGRALADLEDDPEALSIKITGKQWWWHVEYEPNDPQRIITTANEIHVPVGKLVHLELTSGDVIHSFWVPSVHGKRDLIPGRINRTWLRVDEPGVFRGQCAEFCGLEHANMAITIVAQPAGEFEEWFARQRSPASPPTTPTQQRGLAIFLGSPCAMCHTVAGTTAGGRLGPDLTHVATRMTLGAGTLRNSPDALAKWVRNAHTFKPGVHMPAIALSSTDEDALIAFLESLR